MLQYRNNSYFWQEITQSAKVGSKLESKPVRSLSHSFTLSNRVQTSQASHIEHETRSCRLSRPPAWRGTHLTFSSFVWEDLSDSECRWAKKSNEPCNKTRSLQETRRLLKEHVKGNGWWLSSYGRTGCCTNQKTEQGKAWMSLALVCWLQYKKYSVGQRYALLNQNYVEEPTEWYVFENR